MAIDDRPGTPIVPAAPVLRAAADVDVAGMGPNRVAFAIGAADTGGRFSLTEFTMAAPPAAGPPPHVHEDSDECVYVLDGTVEMGVGDERLVGGAGAVMLAPRGTRHSIANVGSGAARFVVVLSPSGFEGFWREMAALTSSSNGPPDPARVRDLQRRYHMSTDGLVRRYE